MGPETCAAGPAGAPGLAQPQSARRQSRVPQLCQLPAAVPEQVAAVEDTALDRRLGAVSDRGRVAGLRSGTARVRTRVVAQDQDLGTLSTAGR